MGTIVFCKYDTDTLENIASWCQENLIPNPTGKSRIHTSVIWSRADVSEEWWLDRDVSHFRKIDFKVTGLELFDHFSKRSQVMQKCLVIKLDAPYLVRCHKHMIKHGGTHEHVFVPHVTVCYDFPTERNITEISVPSFKLKPNKIFTERFTPPER